MSSVGRILDIARRAMAAQQTGMNVTGHNIANVNTPGFSRQRLTLASTSPEHTNWGFVGTGVGVAEVNRVRDGFIDAEIRLEKQSLHRWSQRERVFTEIENVFNEPSDSGLSTILADFWDSWEGLANDPQSGSAREWVKQMGSHLTNTFSHLHTRLTDIQANLNDEFQLGITEVNTFLKQIADLNQKIASSESRGIQANDYRDKRDILLDDLSELIGARFIERKDGMVTITLDGQILLEREKVHELETLERGINYIAVSDPIWSTNKSPIALGNGKLQGLIELRDDVIGDQFAKLDEMAVALVEEVNRLHRSAYNQSGLTGADFFDGNTTGARNFAMDETILEDASKIAVSADGSLGDGSIALQIAELRESKVLSDDTVTVDDYFAAMMGSLGVQSRESTFMRENQELMVEQLQNQRDSVSGVSLDEEMANLIKYQHAYEAAARLVRSVDEMMKTVIDMV